MDKTTHIERFFNNFLANYTDIFFIKNNDNEYTLFNLYILKKANGVVSVTKKSDDSLHYFINMKNATVWCILDKYNKIYPANRVLELDNKIASALVDKKIHFKFSKMNDRDKAEIYRDKFSVDLNKITLFQKELDKYIIMADNCQLRGFKK